MDDQRGVEPVSGELVVGIVELVERLPRVECFVVVLPARVASGDIALPLVVASVPDGVVFTPVSMGLAPIWPGSVALLAGIDPGAPGCVPMPGVPLCGILALPAEPAVPVPEVPDVPPDCAHATTGVKASTIAAKIFRISSLLTCFRRTASTGEQPPSFLRQIANDSFRASYARNHLCTARDIPQAELMEPSCPGIACVGLV